MQIADTKLEGISNTLKAQNVSNVPDAKMQKAARDFEAYFVGYIFDTAQASIPKTDLSGEEGEGSSSNSQDVFQSMFIQEIAKKGAVSGRGFGIAESMLRQVKGRQSTTDTQASQISLQVEKSPQDNSVALAIPESQKITSGYGLREDPFTGKVKQHEGIDIAMPVGTPIKAAGDGTIVFSGDKGGYGQAVVIQHDKHYATLYGHADEMVVQVGQKVSRGEVVGFSGSSGRSTGPHLHFEVQKDGKAVDPQRMKTFEKII